MNEQQNKSTKFGSGFALGLLAGTMGYFLFATKKGQKARGRLEIEWEEAKEQLVKQGVLKDTNMTLRELVSTVKETLEKKCGMKIEEEVPEPKPKPKKTKRRSTKKKSTPKKFKGAVK